MPGVRERLFAVAKLGNVYPVYVENEDDDTVRVGLKKSALCLIASVVGISVLLGSLYAQRTTEAVQVDVRGNLGAFLAIEREDPTCACSGSAGSMRLGDAAWIREDNASTAYTQAFSRNLCSALRRIRDNISLIPPIFFDRGSSYLSSESRLTKAFFICDHFTISETQLLLSFASALVPLTSLMAPNAFSDLARTTLADKLQRLVSTWDSIVLTYQTTDATNPLLIFFPPLASASASATPSPAAPPSASMSPSSTATPLATATPSPSATAFGRFGTPENFAWGAYARSLGISYNAPDVLQTRQMGYNASTVELVGVYFLYVLFGPLQSYYNLSDVSLAFPGYGDFAGFMRSYIPVMPDLSRVRNDILEVDFSAYFAACKPLSCTVWRPPSTASIINAISNTLASVTTNVIAAVPLLWTALTLLCAWLAARFCAPSRSLRALASKTAAPSPGDAFDSSLSTINPVALRLSTANRVEAAMASREDPL